MKYKSKVKLLRQRHGIKEMKAHISVLEEEITRLRYASKTPLEIFKEKLENFLPVMTDFDIQLSGQHGTLTITYYVSPNRKLKESVIEKFPFLQSTWSFNNPLYTEVFTFELADLERHMRNN